MKTGKVVMVTGASAGLGRAIVRAFGKQRARVGLIARNAEALDACAREVRELGGDALSLPLDLADAEAVERAALQLEEAFGPIDVWVNNAMLSVFSPVKEMKAEEYRRVTEVTYLGYVHGTLAALHRMLPRNRGTIIQIGSALSHRSIPLQSAYCACKHAIAGFTDSLRCELIHDASNVQLTMVQMPAMNTMQFTWVKSRLPKMPQPVPPIFEPEIAASVVVAAANARRPRREYWVGFSTVAAITGQKFIPGWLDHYLGKSGYESQQTATPDSPDRPNNLWEPVPGIHGSHGPFDTSAKKISVQAFASVHRGLLLTLGAGIGLATASSWYKKRRAVTPEMEKETDAAFFKAHCSHAS